MGFKHKQNNSYITILTIFFTRKSFILFNMHYENLNLFGSKCIL